MIGRIFASAIWGEMGGGRGEGGGGPCLGGLIFGGEGAYYRNLTVLRLGLWDVKVGQETSGTK